MDVQAVAQLFKSLAVFGKVNRVCACSQNLYALLVKKFRKLYRRSAAERHHNANRVFHGKHIHHIGGSQRLKIQPVRRVKVG